MTRYFNIFLTIVFILNFKAYAEEVFCNDATIEDPPFYISDEYRQGDKIWENLRDIENHSKVSEYIPRGTIVHAPIELSEVSYAPNYRIPVEVVSVPSQEWENDIKGTNRSNQRRRFRHTALTPKGLDRAKAGSKGFLDRRALMPAGKFTFFVKNTMPLEKTPSGRDYKGLPLTLKMQGDEYVGQNCCELSDEPQCFFKYTFQALSKDQVVLEEFNINPLACQLLEHIQPVPKRKEIDSAVLNIMAKLGEEYPGFGIGEGIETDDIKLSGIRYLPEHKGSSISRIHRDYMVKIPLDPDTDKGPYNSFHYKPDDDNSSDTYLQPESLCAFTEVLKQFNKKCTGAGCQVQFGNFYHSPSWNTHKTHGSGHCVDIRPQRKNSDLDVSLNYNTTNTGRYSREKTKDLVDILVKAGGSPIYFNDKKIKGVTPLARHSNHIHVCFKPERQKVKDACRKGL